MSDHGLVLRSAARQIPLQRQVQAFSTGSAWSEAVSLLRLALTDRKGQIYKALVTSEAGCHGKRTILREVFHSPAFVMGCSVPLKRLLSVLMLGAVLPATASPKLRSSFPGRRVGGGTRGECTARLLVHLVPQNSVFAPDAERLLGILQGPTQDPKPLLMDLRRLATAGTVANAKNRVKRIRLAPSRVGISLFRAPVANGVVWESSYQCIEPQPGVDVLSWDGGFDAPPAITLLLAEPTPLDLSLQERLKALADQCDGSVAKERLIKDFSLAALDLSSWPDRLPVRCLF